MPIRRRMQKPRTPPMAFLRVASPAIDGGIKQDSAPRDGRGDPDEDFIKGSNPASGFPVRRSA